MTHMACRPETKHGPRTLPAAFVVGSIASTARNLGKRQFDIAKVAGTHFTATCRLLRVGYLPLRCSIPSVFCVVCSTRPCLLDGKAGGLPSSLSTSPIHVRCVRRQGCDSLLVPLGGGKRCLNANVNCAQGPCDHACTVIKGCSVRSRVASFAAQRRDARSWHARTGLCCGDDTVLAFRWA